MAGIIRLLSASLYGHLFFWHNTGNMVVRSVVPFTELPCQGIAGCVVLVDVDGTIVADGETVPAAITVNKLQELQASNAVWICSNTTREKRLEELARLTGIPILAVRHRKPGHRLQAAVTMLCAGQPLVVIGDKFWTDERLARRLGAQFIRVGRLRSANDRWFSRMGFIVDDGLYRVAKWLERLRPAKGS